MVKILVVDDEPKNIRLIERYCCDTDYEFVKAENGQQGWALLEQHFRDLDCVLLDRMMPGMNGIEFMEKVKKDKRFENIPVIMQTASAETGKIAEGINAGVYYYLTKPFSQEVLLSVVEAAIRDYQHFKELKSRVANQNQVSKLVTHCCFEFSHLEQAIGLASHIANMFPDPQRVVLGISELLINAVEHGNLGISYDEKSELMRSGTWKSEIERRLLLPEFSAKKVRVEFQRSTDGIFLTITDEGAGFDCRNFLEIDPQRATHAHGRGIAMSRMISFDQVEYLGKGNQVRCFIQG